MDSEGRLRVILLEFKREGLGGQGKLHLLAAAQKMEMKEGKCRPLQLNQYEVSYLEEDWFLDKSGKAQSTRQNMLRHWPALEKNAFLRNSEMGAGLTQPCVAVAYFLRDAVGVGFLGRNVPH